MKRLFTEHPETIGETYTEHFGQATSFGTEMIVCGLACIVHGFLPFVFEKTGSDAIVRLHRRMVTHRDRRNASYAAVPAE
ncbi:MAG: DUF6356 family protein [Parvularculaceae bacterium]